MRMEELREYPNPGHVAQVRVCKYPEAAVVRWIERKERFQTASRGVVGQEGYPDTLCRHRPHGRQVPRRRHETFGRVFSVHRREDRQPQEACVAANQPV